MARDNYSYEKRRKEIEKQKKKEEKRLKKLARKKGEEIAEGSTDEAVEEKTGIEGSGEESEGGQDIPTEE